MVARRKTRSDAALGRHFNNELPSLLKALELLPLAARDENLVQALAAQSETRDRFLPSIVRPDGILPSIGKNNPWRQFGETKPVAPPSRAFTSILFPYGGYAVLRDGWERDSLYLFMKTSRPASGHWRSQEGGLQVAAHGRNLLVSSVGELYDARDAEGGWSRYWYSAAGQNTILVDGRSAVRRPWENLPPDSALWHTSGRYDVVETLIASGFGGGDIFHPDASAPKGPPGEAEITDTTHARRVIFLREVGAWIVIDTIRSETPRRITQTWNFGPEYSPDEVVADASAKQIETRQPNAPNLLIRQFGGPGLDYRKFFGQRDKDGLFGWVGILKDREKWLYTPAVDVHANWRNEGTQTVVSLLVPLRSGQKPDFDLRDASRAGVAGFDLTVPGGRRIAFRHADAPIHLEADGVSAEARSLLVETRPDGTANGLAFECTAINGKATPGPDFEFSGQPARKPWWEFWQESSAPDFQFSLMSFPELFVWRKTDQGQVPGWTTPRGGP